MNLHFEHQSWPISETFSIARGAKNSADVIFLTLQKEAITGRGEAVPYKRYGETIASVLAQLEEIKSALKSNSNMPKRLAQLPDGSAKAALDCAWLDYRAKSEGLDLSDYFALPSIRPVPTAYTISLDHPDVMAKKAKKAAMRFALIKLKLGGNDGQDQTRISTIRKALPRHRLIIDANEGWQKDEIKDHLRHAADHKIELIEQPLPQADDDYLKEIAHPVPLCADESFKTADNLETLKGKYEAVNIKLDKTGGLTGAVKAAKQAQNLKFDIMLGSMVATSLALAPMMLLTPLAKWVDLDSPALLAKDRAFGLMINKEGIIHPPEKNLWG